MPNLQEIDNCHKNLLNIIHKFNTQRDFARAISEDSADVNRWHSGKNLIKARAVISICRLFPEIVPADLNPFIFPKDARIVFIKNKG